MKTRLLLMALGVFPVLTQTGCICWHPGEEQPTEQGAALQKMYMDHRTVQTNVPNGLPVTFEPVAINRSPGPNGMSYSATVEWRRAGRPDEIEVELKKLATAHAAKTGGTQPGPDQKVRLVRLKLRYVGEDGQPLGEEIITIDVRNASGTVKLDQYGATGPVTKVVAEIEDVVFEEPPAGPNTEK